MDTLINELLLQLRPALKNKTRAEQLLKDYWADKIALLWSVENVHRAANEKKTVLTHEQARQILRQLHQQHDPQHGLKWEDLHEAINQSGQGRDITPTELYRFIHQDVLVIDPPNKRARK